MMDEIIHKVVEKTGLDEQTARTAVDTVLEQVRKHLPEPLASQFESMFPQHSVAGAGTESSGTTGTTETGIGGMLKKVGL